MISQICIILYSNKYILRRQTEREGERESECVRERERMRE